jgi:outer membrane protein assembly factor BamB
MSRAKILSLAKYVLAYSAGILWLTASSFSQSITVSPASNPPNTTIFVSGSGFSAGADVDIYFDTTDLALAVTDETGSFSQIALHVPASALPGEHTVSAVEPSTGANAQTPFRVDTPWAQFHKQASHDGYNSTENVLGPDNVGSLRARWKYRTGFFVHSSPAVANGVVYVGSFDNNVYALNASTGTLLWRYRTGFYVYSSPAVANGVVYVGSTDNNIYALNAGTGALLWKYTTGAVQSSPAVANGVVYVASEDYNVYALNASTGALLSGTSHSRHPGAASARALP